MWCVRDSLANRRHATLRVRVRGRRRRVFPGRARGEGRLLAGASGPTTRKEHAFPAKWPEGFINELLTRDTSRLLKKLP